jgi:hypothetical protein
MREHGTLREREAAFETLKAMVNANNLKKMQKSFNSLKIQKIKTKLF